MILKVSYLIVIPVLFFVTLEIFSLTISNDNNFVNILHKSHTFQIASAQTATNHNSSNTTNNHDINKSVLREGLITSSQARQNGTAQMAVILPHRSDYKDYTGVLTFSSSQPVDLSLLHRLVIDNKTISHINFKKYGNPLSSWIRDIPSQHKLNHTGLQVTSTIRPNYGTSTPFFSASIPFVASGVSLWSQTGTPFMAMYHVSDKLGQPEMVNNIRSLA